MTGQGVRWTAEQVLALAPDEASRQAGGALSEPGPWQETGAAGAAVWGLCEGSGSMPYETVVDLRVDAAEGPAGPGCRCGCPSRKFPCEHALGLLLLWARDTGGTEEPAVPEGAEPPEWAARWLTARRERDGPGQVNGAAQDSTSGGGPQRTGGDGAARRRSAERRAGRIAAGATELEERLADLLRDGLAGADQAGYGAWDETAARMVDAQAPGLASRVRELGAVASSGSGWPERLLSECALLHLLDRGFLALEGASEEGPSEAGRPPLPEPLAATVRARVGLTVETAELLADEQARVRDTWLVLAQRDEAEGRLTVRRIWLYGRDGGRTALLLSFGAAGRPPELALPVGLSADADLAFYPGAPPLRAALGERHAEPAAGFEPPGCSLRAALEAYGAALTEDPWLEACPVVLRDVLPIPEERDGMTGWQIADAHNGDALPVAPGIPADALWRLTSLSGGGPLTVFGECGHRGFAPYTAWHEGAAVPL